MRRRTATTVAAGLVLAAFVAVPAAAPAHAADAVEAPVKVLVVGDSLTQGSAGDWTWRYRLWKKLSSAGVAVDFVGQRDDLFDNVTQTFGSADSQAYLDPAFDRDHAARWGMLLGSMDRSIGDLVATYHPDIVLELLGDNDLSAGKTPAQVGQLLQGFVGDARAVDPGIDVVLGKDPRPHTQPNATALNTEIDARAAALDTAESRVVVADPFVYAYDDLQDTWDGAHANARGELKIAAGFENALHVLNPAWPAADPIPSVPLGPRVPPVLNATAGVGSVQLSWVRTPGSQKSDVWQRDLTSGGGWQKVAADVTGTSTTVAGLTAWHQVELYTVPYKGFWPAQSDAWSNVVQVQVRGDHLDPPAPSVTATADGVATVQWASVTGAATYAVQWRRADHPGTWLGTVTSSTGSATLPGLTHGVSYVFRVRAENPALVGDWSDEVGAAVPGDNTVRILVVGDSITQGSAGDWTWRYRLWRHLTDAGVPVDFVGPRSDLFDNITGQDGATTYADPAFDQDHAAKWGMALAAQEHPIGELVDDYHPDIVLELLGVNDLTFFGEPPGEVRDRVHDFVDDARSEDPGLGFVLGRVPRSNLPQVATFNGLVSDLAAQLDSPASRVSVASADAGYIEDEDTWDGAHPNSHGELKIAAAFEDALHSMEIGPSAVRPLPEVPRGPRIAPVLSATGQTAGAHLSWVRSPGSTESEVWARDLTDAGAWHRVAEHATGTSYDVTGLTPWHRFQLRTEPYKGTWLAQPDAWSNAVEVDTTGAGLAAPTALAALADAAGVATLTWAPAPGATSYTMQWRRADQPDGWLVTGPFSGPSATVGGLTGRAGYVFRVQAMRGALSSFFSDEATVSVPALSAVGPVLLKATGRGVRTTAGPVTAATSYTLRVATARRCGRLPAAGRFVVAASGLSRPAKKLRLDGRAIWVQWVAERGGVEGDLAPSSTACVKLSR